MGFALAFEPLAPYPLTAYPLSPAVSFCTNFGVRKYVYLSLCVDV